MAYNLDSTKIEMVETTQGCPEACFHCGAYNGFKAEDLRLKSLDPETLIKHIRQKIPGTDLPLIKIFNKFITTYVNGEPLRSANFNDFTELVYDESANQSQVVAISHGVGADIRKMRDRLEKTVQLIKTGVIPLFVLSTDFARKQGQITEETNAESYFQTLNILREALGKARITVSLQGTREDGPLSLFRTKNMFSKILDRLNLSDLETIQLTINERSYTKTGRAESNLEIAESEDCDVIPDPEFVRTQLPTNHKNRAMIKFDGTLVVQPNRPGKTYGDSVNKALWKPIKL